MKSNIQRITAESLITSSVIYSHIHSTVHTLYSTKELTYYIR